MDPITRMAEEFMKAWLRFRQSGKASFFRIDTDPSMHADLWRVFRAIEMSPDNRAPYLMFTAPFCDPRQFFEAAVAKLASDYALLREGLAKDGVSINDLVLPPLFGYEPEEWFALVVETIWGHVKSQFEYLMIIFLPERVENKVDFARSIERLVALLSAPNFRIALADFQEPILLDICKKLDRQALSGRFFIPSKTLQEYLLKMAEGGWGALSDDKNASQKPATEPVPEAASSKPASDAAKTQVDSSANQILPAGEAQRLRICMAKAATASSEQNTFGAVEALRQAQTICHRNGLATHEAIMLMAIANSFLASQSIDEAVIHYEQAAKIAAEASAPMVVMQARMGCASALFHAQSYDLAAQTYEQAAEAARKAESEVMRIEALRMAGTCHTSHGRFNLAADCWNRALETAGKLPALEVNASTFAEVGEHFAAQCEQQGLAEQAKSVRQQVDLIRRQTALRDKESSEVGVAS
jgi:tetratricopeptide (TPR) repeat protein